MNLHYPEMEHIYKDIIDMKEQFILDDDEVIDRMDEAYYDINRIRIETNLFSDLQIMERIHKIKKIMNKT